MFPDNLGDKNADTIEKSWAEYHANRPVEHDCKVNEDKNWYGNHRCRFSWECKGAAMCELHVYNNAGNIGIGWCRGATACPHVGPLDSYEEDYEDPSVGLKLNPGGSHKRDLDEWE